MSDKDKFLTENSHVICIFTDLILFQLLSQKLLYPKQDIQCCLEEKGFWNKISSKRIYKLCDWYAHIYPVFYICLTFILTK